MIKHYYIIDMRSQRAKEYQAAGNMPLRTNYTPVGVFMFDSTIPGLRAWQVVEELSAQALETAFNTYTRGE